MKRVCIPYRDESRVQPYMAAVNAAGARAVPVSVSDFPSLHSDLLSTYDGLVLTGGTDINPALYGQKPNEHVDPPDNERDEVEWQLLTWALQQDLPVLAICRGMQLLNAHMGGTLIQHLGSSRHDTEFADKATVAHEVTIEPASQLAGIVGTTILPVNSRHHQAIDRIGAGLRVSARDEDVIEGLEHPGYCFLIAVQWHPEDQAPASEPNRRLFERFAASLVTNSKP